LFVFFTWSSIELSFDGGWTSSTGWSCLVLFGF